MRKLASIRTISKVDPIKDADAIDVATIDGWRTVIKKGEFKSGDTIVFCETDSWIPHDLAPFLSRGREPREYQGIRGERLRTMKLRGVLSQGLVLPVSVLPSGTYEIGQDVSELLNIVKWEPEIPACLYGLIRGNFPDFAFKTDETRIQNCYEDLKDYLSTEWVVEEKLDGSSCSVIYYNGDQHVCSRNLSLKLEDDNNSFVSTVKRNGLLDAMAAYGRNIQISGELIGTGIQGNPYGIRGQELFVFEVRDLDTGSRIGYKHRNEILDELEKLGASVKRVPVVSLGTFDHMTCDDILLFAEGKSVLNVNTEREGLVFKNIQNPDVTFKAISNKFLLKTGG